MKQLIVIGEGPTEQAFCQDVLYHHFLSIEIHLHNPKIKRSKGGIVAWSILKKEIENYLKNSPSAFVTTLIDFYGIKDHHNFPLWVESKMLTSINERVTMLENAMKAEIAENIRHRFIPYIQVYEFEALLFSDTAIFTTLFQQSDFLDHHLLQNTLQINPEEINDGLHTAPSKRLEKIIKGYDKVFYGSLIAQEIGIEKIRAKCPRFNAWIEQLEGL